MTRPLEWQLLIRDHPRRPPSAQCHVLTMLTLRLDWQDGTGFASVEDLTRDAQVREATVRRALRWARAEGLLVCTRRGHRLGNGKTAASEWQLRGGSQAVTRDRLTSVSSGQKRDLKRSETTSQAVSRDTPSRPSPSRPSASSLAQLTARALAETDADEREIADIIDNMRATPAIGSVPLVLAHELDDGGLFAERLARYRNGDIAPGAVEQWFND